MPPIIGHQSKWGTDHTCLNHMPQSQWAPITCHQSHMTPITLYTNHSGHESQWVPITLVTNYTGTNHCRHQSHATNHRTTIKVGHQSHMPQSQWGPITGHQSQWAPIMVGTNHTGHKSSALYHAKRALCCYVLYPKIIYSLMVILVTMSVATITTLNELSI